MSNLLAKLFSGLTQEGVTLPNGQFQNAAQAEDNIPQLPDAVRSAGGLNATEAPSTVSKMPFLQASHQGAGGTPNAMAPQLSTKGKILTTILSAAAGGLAGTGQRTVGGGFQSGMELPYQQAQMRQGAQAGQLNNQLLQQQVQYAPMLRQLGIMKDQADIAEKQSSAKKNNFVTPRTGGVYDISGQSYAPGTEPQDKPQSLDQMIAAAAQAAISKGGDPSTDPTVQRLTRAKVALSPKADKPDTPEQQYIDEFRSLHPGTGVIQAEKAYKQDTATPQKDPQQLAVGPDGTVIALKPGMKVPEGTKPASQYGKPTADEQRRADLATNLNENLDQLEEIVNRRPELFGPLAGRWTDLKGKFGSNDPDIAALQVIEHQVGMAQISAHGMRSAHGIEGAANSIFNGLHSGPTALKSAIGAVRNSVKTFQNDVTTAKGGNTAPSAGAIQIIRDKNGRITGIK